MASSRLGRPQGRTIPGRHLPNHTETTMHYLDANVIEVGMSSADRNRSEHAEIRLPGHLPNGRRAGEPAIYLPSPSLWPVVVAAGFTLVMFGVIIHPGFVALGILMMILGLARWIGELFRG